MLIDQIFVLKSFSEYDVLKRFSNLFHTLPVWYANDLKATVCDVTKLECYLGTLNRIKLI